MTGGEPVRWTINGRYLTQQVTGVQRYAREIVDAMARQLAAEATPGATPGLSLKIVRPPSSVVEQGKAGDCGDACAPFALHMAGNGAGHRWEQSSLPSLVDGGLLCLCNTGPLRVARQILCIHDTNVYGYPSSYSLPFRFAYRTMLPILGRRVAALVTVSRTSATLLKAHGVSGRREITVLPNGHEHVFRWDAARSTVLDGVAQTRPFVLLIGSQAPHKNMARILSLAAALDRLGFDIYVSGGRNKVFSAEASEGKGAQAAPNVRYLGFVSDDDLALLYQRAMCLVFPSYVEGFGLPIVEAMALGCPVIASNTSCMPEIVGAAGLLAPPDSKDAWLKQIDRLAHSRALREQLVGLGRERVKAFSWKSSAAGYLDLMSSI